MLKLSHLGIIAHLKRRFPRGTNDAIPGDRSCWPRQGLFWPYYTVFSVEERPVKGPNRGPLAYLVGTTTRRLERPRL